MISFTALLLITWCAVFAALFVLWLISLPLWNASIVDPFWGTGFVLVAWLSLFLTENYGLRGGLLAALTTLWGLRLSLYLLWRNWGHGEDRRYAAMRAHHGPRFWWVSLFTVFWLQAGILWIVSLPIQFALRTSPAEAPLNWLDFLGLAVWLVGFLFESIGDWQMARFQADPVHAGQVMDRGLWRYTRHPNYFGDFCVWWGLYFIAAAGGAGWTVFCPLLMSFLLLKVSGVTLLEQTIGDRRPDYAAYKQRTSPFFPWFPRSAPQAAR